MSSDRRFPYWRGWHAVGCAVFFFGLLGMIAVTLLPAGYDRVRAGDLPTGVAMMVMGVFGVPTLTLALWSLAKGVWNTFRPPVVAVTATELLVPPDARGEPPQNEYGETLTTEPPHPAAVPLVALRKVERVGPVHNQVLEVTYDGGPIPLRFELHMMRVADFNELENLLRAAVNPTPGPPVNE